MHFGLPPRFKKDVRIVQLDIAPEAISQNVPAEVALVGDGKAIVGQLNKALESFEYHYPENTDWHKAIAEKSAANAKQIKPMIDDESAPTNYYRAFRDITPWIPENAIIIGEGANTMDIGRTQMPNKNPRTRLDAGSYGTMGVGMGLAMAAAVVHPDRPVISVSGDSAIGFSGMEMETVCRHKMNVKVVVLNNGGIGSGVAELPADLQKGTANLLTVGCRYDKMMEAFGGKGYFVTDPKDLKAALDGAMKFNGPALVNVQLHHAAGRKPQQFKWHTSAEEQ
jgi:2-hydroxyacyl-CoA lyase 1